MLASLVAGCALATGGSTARARQVADDYLAALTTDGGDRGWSLILPDSRRAYADQDQYTALAEAGDWSAFAWSEVDGDHCQDGGAYCVVRIEIEPGQHGVPGWMLDAPQSDEANRYFTLNLDEDPTTPGNAEMVVYFDSDGDSGVLLGGG